MALFGDFLSNVAYANQGIAIKQEADDTHALRQAQISQMQRAAQAQEEQKTLAAQAFGGGDVQAPSSATPAQEGGNVFLEQISKQKTLAEQQETLAKNLAKAGQLDASTKMFDDARGTRRGIAELSKENASEEQKKQERVGAVLGPVAETPTQEAWDVARNQIIAENPKVGNTLPKELTPAVAQWVKQTVQSSMSAKDQMIRAQKIIEETRRSEEAKERAIDRDEARQDRKINQAANRELSYLRLDETRLARLAREKKVAAQKAKAQALPRSDDTKAAASRIKEDFPDLPKGDRENAALAVSSKAKLLLVNGEYEDFAEATQAAYDEVKGNITTEESFLPFGWGDKTKYERGVTTPATVTKPAVSFESGKVYQDASGNKAKYVNGKWEPVK